MKKIEKRDDEYGCIYGWESALRAIAVNITPHVSQRPHSLPHNTTPWVLYRSNVPAPDTLSRRSINPVASLFCPLLSSPLHPRLRRDEGKLDVLEVYSDTVLWTKKYVRPTKSLDFSHPLIYIYVFLLLPIFSLSLCVLSKMEGALIL